MAVSPHRQASSMASWMNIYCSWTHTSQDILSYPRISLKNRKEIAQNLLHGSPKQMWLNADVHAGWWLMGDGAMNNMRWLLHFWQWIEGVGVTWSMQVCVYTLLYSVNRDCASCLLLLLQQWRMEALKPRCNSWSRHWMSPKWDISTSAYYGHNNILTEKYTNTLLYYTKQ